MVLFFWNQLIFFGGIKMEVLSEVLGEVFGYGNTGHV